MAIFLPAPTSHSIFSNHHNTNRWPHAPYPNLKKLSFKPTFCSSSTAQTTVEGSPPSPTDATQSPIGISDELPVSFSGCKACGRDEIEKGCNGEGRIQGGIATVPGFSWWPIKAFRPCPGFVASGGRYRRRGQSMDEVAFGREESEASIGSTKKESG